MPSRLTRLTFGLRVHAIAFAIAASALVVSCGDGSARHGLRDTCGNFGGGGLECEHAPIESSIDACWKLVECGAIPLENPPTNEDCCLDWQFCVEELEETTDLNRDFALACIEASSCDDLKTDRSPEGPGRGGMGLPLCLQF